MSCDICPLCGETTHRSGHKPKRNWTRERWCRFPAPVAHLRHLIARDASGMNSLEVIKTMTTTPETAVEIRSLFRRAVKADAADIRELKPQVRSEQRAESDKARAMQSKLARLRRAARARHVAYSLWRGRSGPKSRTTILTAIRRCPTRSPRPGRRWPARWGMRARL